LLWVLKIIVSAHRQFFVFYFEWVPGVRLDFRLLYFWVYRLFAWRQSGGRQDAWKGRRHFNSRLNVKHLDVIFHLLFAVGQNEDSAVQKVSPKKQPV
jgi:hypothetical protein